MSMFSYVKGIIDIEQIEKAQKAKELLLELNVDIPEEVYEIIETSVSIPVNRTTTDSEEIYEIDVKNIPEKVTKIRFINSY